jgi:hypothetical protein
MYPVLQAWTISNLKLVSYRSNTGKEKDCKFKLLRWGQTLEQSTLYLKLSPFLTFFCSTGTKVMISLQEGQILLPLRLRLWMLWMEKAVLILVDFPLENWWWCCGCQLAPWNTCCMWWLLLLVHVTKVMCQIHQYWMATICKHEGKKEDILQQESCTRTSSMFLEAMMVAQAHQRQQSSFA